jgi:hypothetical protein
MMLLVALLGMADGWANAATWNVGNGNWSVDGNWTSPANAPDVAGETATISAAGTYTVTLDIDPTIDSLTIDSANAKLYANNRTLTTDGPFNITSGLAEFRSSDISGSGTLTNDGFLTLVSTLADSTNINTGLINNGTLLVRGINSGFHTTVQIANGFTNNGLLRLATDNGWSANLIVGGSETIVNSTTGIFQAKNLVAGTATTLSASITNSGSIDLVNSINFNKAGATITNDAATSSFTVGTGATATFTTGAFDQTAGSTTINTGAVVKGLSSFTFGNGSVTVDGSLSTGTFAQNGGIITGEGTITVGNGNALALNAGSMGGNLKFRLGGTTVATPGTLAIDSNYNYDANTELSGYVNITGPFTVNAGRTFSALTLLGTGNAETVTAPAFTNRGTTNLSGGITNVGWYMTLAVPTGTLTNSATGTINVTDGLGVSGKRTLSAELANLGTLNVQAPGNTVTIGRTGAAHTNSGLIDMQSSASFIGSSFTQTGGTFQLTGGTSTFGTSTVSFIGGTLQGGLGILSANVDATAGGTGLTLSPGQSTGRLNITGIVTLDTNDSLAIELGGINQAATTNGYDWVNVIGATTLGNATLDITFVDGFTPTSLDTFTILTSTGGLTGKFGNGLLGTVLGGGYQFDISYSGNSVILSNAQEVLPAPEPASLALLACGTLILVGKRRRRR